MQEIWKDVKGFEGLYQVSNMGRVKSIVFFNSIYKKYYPRIKIMKLYKDKKGYLRVDLRNREKRKCYLVHRLVAEHFISNPENKPQINHINCIKDDNRVNNLEWCTNDENMAHAVMNKLMDNKLAKKVNQYDLQGNFLKQWRSINEPMKFYKTSHIWECCHGKRKTCVGYIWKYADK